MPSNCKSLKDEYERLKAMKDRFALALERVKETGDFEGLIEMKTELETARTQLKEKLVVSPEKARELLGVNFFYGREAIARTFGFEVPISEIPRIPYSQEQLKQAKKLGEMLVLRVSHDGENNPMTIERMWDILRQVYTKATIRQFTLHFDDTSVGIFEDFYCAHPLKTEWKLVRTSFIPDVHSQKNDQGEYTKDSTHRNYFHQTRLLRDYLKSIDALSAEEEQECTDEMLIELCDELGMDWYTSTKINPSKFTSNRETVTYKLTELKINKHHRRTPAEIFYDWIIFFQNSTDRSLLEPRMDSSSAVTQDFHFVTLGSFFLRPRIYSYTPNHQDSKLGVISVR